MICAGLAVLAKVRAFTFTYLGHHAPPGHQGSINLLALLLLVGNDGLEQALNVLVSRVILLLKGVEALGQICAQLWCVVVLERRGVGVVLVVLVIGEAGKLLCQMYRVSQFHEAINSNW